MFIISEKKYLFKAANGSRFVTKGGKVMEEAPQWISKDPLFKLAKKAGHIIVAQAPTDRAEAAAVAEVEKDKALKAEAAEEAKE